MKILKICSNHNKLIKFYKNNGIEIDNNNGYVFKPKVSYIIEENENLVGAITFSDFENGILIEAIAVLENRRNNGIGKKLIKKVMDENDRIFLVSKVSNYFENLGFKVTNKYNDLLNRCKNCENFETTCFPKVMIYEK